MRCLLRYSLYIIGRQDVFQQNVQTGILEGLDMKLLKSHKQYSTQDYLRLIENAERAYIRCVESGSKWGQNYWKGVVGELCKQATVH